MTTQDEFGDIERRVMANISQSEENWQIVRANLAVIRSASWRLIRNRRLLDRNRELLDASQRLLAENQVLLMRRWAILNGS